MTKCLRVAAGTPALQGVSCHRPIRRVILLRFDRVKMCDARKVTIYPVMREAMTVTSRTPSMRPASAHERAMAPATSDMSNIIFVLPNGFPSRREVYFTNPSALIIATSGFISRVTPIPCISHPRIRIDTAMV